MQVVYKPGATAPYLARELGKAHGFSKNYRWDKANKFTQEMEPQDVDQLRGVNPVDAEDFEFADQAGLSAAGSAGKGK